MSYTLEQALALLDTPDYSGLDGLRRLAAETSAIPTGGAPNASLLLYAGKVGDYDAWQLVTTLSADSIDAGGAKSKKGARFKLNSAPRVTRRRNLIFAHFSGSTATGYLTAIT